VRGAKQRVSATPRPLESANTPCSYAGATRLPLSRREDPCMRGRRRVCSIVRFLCSCLFRIDNYCALDICREHAATKTVRDLCRPIANFFDE